MANVLRAIYLSSPQNLSWGTLYQPSPFISLVLLFFLKTLFIFRDRGREREEEGEKHRCARGTLTGCLLHIPNRKPGQQPRSVPWLGIKSANLSVVRLALSPLSHTSQGYRLGPYVCVYHKPFDSHCYSSYLLFFLTCSSILANSLLLLYLFIFKPSTN